MIGSNNQLILMPSVGPRRKGNWRLMEDMEIRFKFVCVFVGGSMCVCRWMYVC